MNTRKFKGESCTCIFGIFLNVLFECSRKEGTVKRETFMSHFEYVKHVICGTVKTESCDG